MQQCRYEWVFLEFVLTESQKNLSFPSASPSTLGVGASSLGPAADEAASHPALQPALWLLGCLLQFSGDHTCAAVPFFLGLDHPLLLLVPSFHSWNQVAKPSEVRMQSLLVYCCTDLGELMECSFCLWGQLLSLCPSNKHSGV